MQKLNNAKHALYWIVNILNKYNIPYQIEGGLAANYYGSNRELADIDIMIPSEGFEKLNEDVKEYSEFGPEMHFGTHWKLIYQILNFKGQIIELCDANNAEYLDSENNTWKKINIDFTKSETVQIFELNVQLISGSELIKYKSRLQRDVDVIDVEQILKNI